MSKLKIDEAPEAVVIKTASITPKDSKTLMQMHMEEDMKMVKGTFRNLECPGAEQLVEIRKYPGVEYSKILRDGQRYEIPKYVALHINGIDRVAEKIGGQVHSCQQPTNAYKIPESGQLPRSVDDGGTLKPEIVPVAWRRRYAFDSIEFNSEF